MRADDAFFAIRIKRRRSKADFAATLPAGARPGPAQQLRQPLRPRVRQFRPVRVLCPSGMDALIITEAAAAVKRACGRGPFFKGTAPAADFPPAQTLYLRSVGVRGPPRVRTCVQGGMPAQRKG